MGSNVRVKRAVWPGVDVFRHVWLVLVVAAFFVARAVMAQTRPNILLIMADDMGYSDLGCYGSEIETPNIDRLAADGVRFRTFYNAARCCPTRAALLTGLYPHQAGMGGMVGGPKALPGPYQGYLNRECVTLAEVLRAAGYSTFMAGKWHVGEFRPAWPVDRGFDRYYGLISGAMNYFNIRLAKRKGLVRVFAVDDQLYQPPADGFYATDAFTDHALEMLRNRDRSRPFFLYLAYNAPHWPLHAHEEDIRRYQGSYMDGWEALRQRRYRKMVDMGIIDERYRLVPEDPAVPAWEMLSLDKKREMDRKMAVYAAQIHRMDWNIGRVLDYLKEDGALENTVVMFLCDNGGCHEGGPLGGNFRPDLTGPVGSAQSYHSYGQGWAHASNTPFRKYKHWVHEGGIATPFIVYWPGKIADPGAIRSHVGHVIDIMPTVLELTGAIYPTTFRGHRIRPLEGESLLPAILGIQERPDRELYWEHMENRAVRIGRWKLVGERGRPWELYDLQQDPTELENLVETQSEKAQELLDRWLEWAHRVGVRNPDRYAQLR